jgi:5'-nucleotidase
MVAPSIERSTTGHTLTLNDPLWVKKLEKNVYSCSGFPADCVYVALSLIYKNEKPDLVISGINRGANLAQDIYYSGTVAAAREAVFQGVKAMAVSLVLDHDSSQASHQYETASEFVHQILQQNFVAQLPLGVLMNVNVPNLPFSDLQGVEAADLGFRNYSLGVIGREDPRGREYFWIGGQYRGHNEVPGSDSYIVHQKKISMTALTPLKRQAEWSPEITQMISGLKLASL